MDETTDFTLVPRGPFSLPRKDALAELQELPGIGPFAAELILLRGAGDPDGLPGNERRMQRAMVRAYGLEAQPAPERLHAIADGWRPYRTWVSLLLRTELEDETHEIAGQRQ
jgi:DNA-3-methyladenine glycosylase II